MITVTLPYEEYEQLKKGLAQYKSEHWNEYLYRSACENKIRLLKEELEKYKTLNNDTDTNIGKKD